MKLKSGLFVCVLASWWVFGSVLPAWGQIRPRPLALSFLLDNVMNEQGGLYAKYFRLHVGEEPTPGRDVFLQNSSLLMLYSARGKDRLLLDQQVRLLEEHFLDAHRDLLHWRLDSNLRRVLGAGGIYANAPGDSLRVIEALFAASEMWGGDTYPKLAQRIGDGLREHNVAPDETLRAYTWWTPEGTAAGRGQAVVFAHLNLVAMAALAREDPSWEGVAAKSLRILLSGVTDNGLFYFSYFPHEGRYDPGDGSLIHMAQAALHLGTYGRKYGDPASVEAARRFLAFVRDEYTSRGKIPARYDPVTGEPTVTWENVAVYALVAQLAFALGEIEFAATIVDREILPHQQLDPESPVYGAFTMSFSEAYTYDTLEVLLALTYHLARCAVGMEEELIRAVWYIGWEQDSYAQRNVAQDLRTLQARLCPNYIGLFAIVYQAGKTSSNPHRDPARTVSDDTLRHVIAQIRRLGMGVVLLTPLFPDDGTWQGVIRPDDLDRWFEHWREILVHYAQLAEETGVEILLLGSELTTLQGYADRWNELIVAVRSRFRGRIGYSANFWPDREHFRQVFNMTQWQNLDFIGVTGYFEVATTTDPTIAELEAGWRNDRVGQNPVADLEALSSKFGKPVVFWEIGYQSRDGTSMYPWNFLRPGRDDEREQADAWTAFLNVFEDMEWFGGYGIYAELVGLPKVPMMYTVLGKEAERVLARHCRE